MVANPRHPCKRFMRATARAARVVQRCSQRTVWTLWNQAELAPELVRRIAGLEAPAEHADTCPCGARKPQPLSLIKLDASTYFKGADLERGTEAVRELLEEVRSETGRNAVLLPSDGKPGKLTSVRPEDPHRPLVVTFDEIAAGFDYARYDDGMLVGDLPVRRKTGWPMGGSHSEPATLVDSGTFVSRIHRDEAAWQHTGLAWGGLRPEKVLAGMQHVDDLLAASCIHCPDCLAKGLGRTFPADLAFEREAVGPAVRFLAVVVEAVGTRVSITPFCTELALRARTLGLPGRGQSAGVRQPGGLNERGAPALPTAAPARAGGSGAGLAEPLQAHSRTAPPGGAGCGLAGEIPLGPAQQAAQAARRRLLQGATAVGHGPARTGPNSSPTPRGGGLPTTLRPSPSPLTPHPASRHATTALPATAHHCLPSAAATATAEPAPHRQDQVTGTAATSGRGTSRATRATATSPATTRTADGP